MCKSLSAYHAFPGPNLNVSFSRKDKILPIKVLAKNETIQKILAIWDVIKMSANNNIQEMSALSMESQN